MKRHYVLFSAAIVIFALTLSFRTPTVAQGTSDSQPRSATPHPPQGAGSLGSDSNPIGKPEVNIPEQYWPTKNGIASPNAVTGTAVYFTPQDENTSTTVLFLYNTNSVAATVALQTFWLDGSQQISTMIAIPPLGLVRICGDTVSTISASWSYYVLVNFTTASTYAKMTVPTGVEFDGYVAWDTTGVYDPLTSVQTLPLRFSTDPASVRQPLIQH